MLLSYFFHWGLGITLTRLSLALLLYSVKCIASVLLMFVLSLGPGDHINMSLSGPLIVYSVVTIIQLHFFLRAWELH